MVRKPSKVAHLLRRFVPSEWGGSETAVFNLCRQLRTQSIESTIFCTDALSKPGEETYQQVVVRRFRYCFPWFFLGHDAKRQLERKGGNPLSLSLLRALLQERDLSLIHSHVQLRLGGIARTVARWKRIPYVVSLHAGYLTLPVEQADRMLEPVRNGWEWGKFFGWLLGSRRVLEDADAIICVGRDEYALMAQRYPTKRIRYIPNGVEVAHFRDADPRLFREHLGVPEPIQLVLCVSRIDYQKNQLLLVQAFARFVEQFPDYRLVLIGPVSVESYREELHATAAQLNIADRLTILPGLAPNDPLLASAYKASDFFVLPSVVEPFGIVILEAWASGLPVIASAVGGVVGFTKDRETALLFTSGDADALVAQMTLLASDPPIRSRLVEASADAVNAYDWSTIADQVVALYEEVLGDRSSRFKPSLPPTS